ncbi:MAG: glutamyl-tRNA reductase [Pseudomonadota bacterium]|nr:glutamyl-tRNA reductase [Pseudomonadota bacterium]
MGFFALGISHTTASVELRERVAFTPEHLAAALQDACQHCEARDVVILSTCNRTELYTLTDRPEALVDWLSRFRNLDQSELTHHLYQHEHEAALTHLMRVASGLDSMMLGEPQILGQVKNALQYAREAGSVTPDLSRIFEQAFNAAKKIRTETAVGTQAVSMGFAVVQLARQVFSHLPDTTALLVAAGEMNALVARHLVDQGVGRLLICNRSPERAQQLAAELAGRVAVEVVPFLQLSEVLHRADIISSCTGSLHTVIHLPMVKAALKKRRYQPMLLVDLAVPRDIQPEVGRLDDVYLYTVDDLQDVIEGNLAQRRQAAVEAEVMVSQLAAQVMQQERTREVGPYIARYRQGAEQIKQQELEKALQLLAQGQSAEAVLARLAQSLTAKIIHAPSQLIRDAVNHESTEVLPFVLSSLHLNTPSESA